MRALFILALTLANSAALASPECTSEAPSKWLSESAMREKIAGAGYRIDVFKKTKGNCYEIYGRNPQGKRVEVYYNPVSGEAVRTSSR